MDTMQPTTSRQFDAVPEHDRPVPELTGRWQWKNSRLVTWELTADGRVLTGGKPSEYLYRDAVGFINTGKWVRAIATKVGK